MPVPLHTCKVTQISTYDPEEAATKCERCGYCKRSEERLKRYEQRKADKND